MRTVFSFAAEATELKRYEMINDRYYDLNGASPATPALPCPAFFSVSSPVSGTRSSVPPIVVGRRGGSPAKRLTRVGAAPAAAVKQTFAQSVYYMVVATFLV